MHRLPELQQTQSEDHSLRKPHFAGQELPKLARDSREAQEKHRLLKWVLPTTLTLHTAIECIARRLNSIKLI